LRHNYDAENIPVDAISTYFNDNNIINICQAILGTIQYCKIGGWASVPGRKDYKDLSHAAQLFHFDLDNIGKWLKIFIFTNDVNTNNGPHVFVKGSHKSLPKEFYRDGRFNDELVNQHYNGKISKITAQAGDILIADTIGLHKGDPVLVGHRNLFQILVANTRLGQPYKILDVDKKMADTFTSVYKH
jgi:hypothetical protein